ncbi:MAG: 3-deoxy-manno-octulosonate cytidylyltransferase [Planctomycetales bacterium]|nr:3-deoxy-manno-octulosonate cytidylyltransferase [Planctomycetales bacterium]
MKIIVVIPARYGSNRFEGKVLAQKTGKYLVQHTYERAVCAKTVNQALIAADDRRVLDACRSFGAPCVMTSVEHQSGTDRIAEAVANLDVDIIVNLQADEPEIDPAYIDRVAGLLIDNPKASMATLLAPFETADDVANPNIVKCVTDRAGRAIYFSRSVIPYDRQAGGIGAVENYLRHLGIYAYRKDFLMTFTSLAPGFLEQREKLEQLRAIENSYTILTARVEKAWDGVDTEEQYHAFVKRMTKD